MSVGRENIDLLALALAYHRAPLEHQERLAEIAILPEDMGRLLWLANGSTEILAAAAREVGARASEIRAAALLLLQRLCFTRDASHYRVLGLNPDATAEQIKEHHRLLMRLVHPDRAGAADFWVDSYAARINEAYSVLSRPQTRADYDECLARRQPIATVAPAIPRPRSSTWRETPRRRRLTLAARAHLPALVLGGLGLVAMLGVAGVYLLPKPPVMATTESGSIVAEMPSPSPLSAAPVESTLAAFQARPDWRALEQLEREASARASRMLAEREQLETARQEQLRIEQVELERLREERALLEQQLNAARLEVERRRLEQLRAEQDETERLRTERSNAERRKQEQLRAEQAQAEKLAEQARAERQTAARELTARDLDDLVGRYLSAYQSGDLERLMALFDARARGGGGKNRDRLRRDYADFFGATQTRRLTLTRMRWTVREPTAQGVARYQLREVRTDGATRDYEGSLRFEVLKQDARVLIQKIDFDIRPLE